MDSISVIKRALRMFYERNIYLEVQIFSRRKATEKFFPAEVSREGIARGCGRGGGRNYQGNLQRVRY